MNKEKYISAYILCGGTNKRMQIEKGLISYNGKTFIEWIIEAIRPITKSIFLVTKNKEYQKFGYPLIPDIQHSKGPVGGIFTALKHTKTEYNFILSCDIPKITTHVLKNYLLYNISPNNDVFYLSDNLREYPLIGIYSKKNEFPFEVALKKDQLKLIKLLKKLNCKIIKTKTEDFSALQNINTQDELKKLINQTL